ncbi:MAG: hypothetical protein KZQ73_10445 [Candidatus Thiodiazotropha sp. (ex Semelilucina semeliformis)]|nr:hypothetical protein [Candidatus Thiodiazotropha sp. (ex Semelilucina semeliformis)]
MLKSAKEPPLLAANEGVVSDSQQEVEVPKISMSFLIIIVFALFSAFISAAKAQDTHLLCHESSDLTGVGYKKFKTAKIERGEDNQIVIAEVQEGIAKLATISCDVDPPVNIHSNVSHTTNNWGRLRISATPSSGAGESIFLFNPKHNMAVYVFILSVRGTEDGWGMVYQSMYKCEDKVIGNYADVCNESLTNGSSGPESTELRTVLSAHKP